MNTEVQYALRNERAGLSLNKKDEMSGPKCESEVKECNKLQFASFGHQMIISGKKGQTQTPKTGLDSPQEDATDAEKLSLDYSESQLQKTTQYYLGSNSGVQHRDWNRTAQDGDLLRQNNHAFSRDAQNTHGYPPEYFLDETCTLLESNAQFPANPIQSRVSDQEEFAENQQLQSYLGNH